MKENKNWLKTNKKVSEKTTGKGRKSFPDHISNSITLIDLPDKDTSIFLPHMDKESRLRIAAA